VPQLRITQDAAADELPSRDPVALVLGMLLDSTCVNEAAERRSNDATSTASGVPS
jgi:hypothetical protein